MVQLSPKKCLSVKVGLGEAESAKRSIYYHYKFLSQFLLKFIEVIHYKINLTLIYYLSSSLTNDYVKIVMHKLYPYCRIIITQNKYFYIL